MKIDQLEKCLSCCSNIANKWVIVGKLSKANKYDKIAYNIEKELYPDMIKPPPFSRVWTCCGSIMYSDIWRPFSSIFLRLKGQYPYDCQYILERFGKE